MGQAGWVGVPVARCNKQNDHLGEDQGCVAIEHDLLAQEVVGISNPVLGIEGSVPHKRFIFVKPGTQWCSFIPPHLKFRVFRNYKLKLMFSELNPI